MFEKEAFSEWKAEQYKDQSTEERFEFVEHLHTFPKYFEKTFIDGYNKATAELVEKKTVLEKRCFELEQENETLKMGLQYDSDNRDDILNENSDLQQKYLEESFEKSKLVKENAELREKLRLSDLENHYCLPWCSKLTKAKEIIKKFLLWENSWHNKTESKYELLKQAEQFLNSEVEK